MGYAKRKREYIRILKSQDLDAYTRLLRESGFDGNRETAEIAMKKAICGRLSGSLADESRAWLEERGLFAPKDAEEMKRRSAIAAQRLAMEKAGVKFKIPIQSKTFEDAVHRLLRAFETDPKPATVTTPPPYADAEGYHIGFSREMWGLHFSISRHDQKKIKPEERDALAERLVGLVDGSGHEFMPNISPTVCHIIVNPQMPKGHSTSK